ncbi:MAG: lysylphosphatidylglycerol synthase transmembrane domain-containing protein [Bdellovibrionota bacterium]
MNKKLSSFLKSLLSIAILCALLYLVDLNVLIDSFKNLTAQQIAYLLFISVVLIYVSSLKWSLFLTSFAHRVPVVRLFNLYLVGYFVNLLLPSFLGGDAVRSWYVGKRVGQHQAAAATILERYTGFAAMILLAITFIWFVSLATFEVKILVICAFLGLTAITLLGLSTGVEKVFSHFKSLNSSLPHVKKIQAAFRMAKKDKSLLFKTLLLSLLFHTVAVINTVASANAVGWDAVPVWDLFVVLPIILLIAAIPLAPNGLGLQEGAFFFFLTGLGATPEQALGTALILRAKSYVLALIGGLLWLYLHHEDKKYSNEVVPPGESLH